jgi:hypothetical protein
LKDNVKKKMTPKKGLENSMLHRQEVFNILAKPFGTGSYSRGKIDGGYVGRD